MVSVSRASHAGQQAAAPSSTRANTLHGPRGVCASTTEPSGGCPRGNTSLLPGVATPVACAIPQRVLRIHTATVCSARGQQEAALASVHTEFLHPRTPDDIAVAIERAGRKPRWTRGGRLSATKATPAGGGMRSSITWMPSWRLSLGVAKTKSSRCQ
jgi:hypothetical protein